MIAHQAWEAFGQLRDSTEPGQRERGRRQPTRGRRLNSLSLSLLTHFFSCLMGRLQHVIHGLADTFRWSHTHKFFTVFSKCFSCHHLSMTDFTTKSGFLLLNGKSSNTWFFASANSSLLEHQRAVCTGLGSAVHYSSLPHTSTSLLHAISVFPRKHHAVCV